jgi:hypothetical protein
MGELLAWTPEMRAAELADYFAATKKSNPVAQR